MFTEPQQGADYETLLAVAQRAESLGFGGFFRSDHYLTMGGSGLPGPTDAWITLAGLARETSTIRLGTLVSPVTFRDPGLLAISVAQVGAMSNGRVELGLGTGWYDAEHSAYGFAFPPLGERFDIFAEQLAIMRGLWETPLGETFSFRGSHYTLADSPALPKPVQRPVPIIIGGAGKKRTPRLTAQYATEFKSSISRDPRVLGRDRPGEGRVRVDWPHRPTAHVGRDGDGLRRGRGCVHSPRRRDRTRTGRTSHQRCQRHPRRGWRQPFADSVKPGPSGSTSRSWISTTSTTSI